MSAAVALRPIPLAPFPRREGGSCWRLIVWGAVVFVVAQPLSIAAHIQPLVGRLVDVVRQSDLVVVGIVTRPVGDSANGALQIDVEKVLLGSVQEKSLEVRCTARLGVGERHVVFIATAPGGFRCVQPARSRFPANVEDDADYARTVRAIADALRLPQSKQLPALRAALIPALRSSAMELRYHAGLELVAFNHPDHPLTTEERRAVEEIRDAPDLDPGLPPLIDQLLRE